MGGVPPSGGKPDYRKSNMSMGQWDLVVSPFGVGNCGGGIGREIYIHTQGGDTVAKYMATRYIFDLCL